jgi:glycosyltransferase involved in cell wall biosynthesis
MRYDITIGIPVYQSVDYIQRAMWSVLSQSYPSIEFLVIDDCGMDGSMDIIRKLQYSHPRGSDIHIISHIGNLGASESRNDIIREAQGDYLYFMDSDDVIAENAISLLMQNIRQYDAEIVFGSYERIEISGKRILYQYPALQLIGEDKLAIFAYRKLSGIQASACNYLVKTSLLRDNNLHFIKTDYWEDLVFTFDLVTYISSAVLLPDITYSYLCHEDSLSHYQERRVIPKDEILQNVKTIGYLKKPSSFIYNKVYYPQRCYVIAMMDFYLVFHVLEKRKRIIPKISNQEIKAILSYPATITQIISFRQMRLQNFLLYSIGRLPAFLCLYMVKFIGKLKKLR